MSEYAIRITRLNYRYPDGTKALEGVDLDVRVSERVGIVGPSGAGKSTLLLHLNGVLTGTGLVKVMGCSLADADLREIRRQVGLVFQDPSDQLFCPTVDEDIAFGLLSLGVPAAEIPARVERSLRAVGLDLSTRHRSPHRLSFGERKRVALATVLATEPAILALDEPAGDLDPRNRSAFIKVVGGLSSTLVLATHDLEMILALCPRTIVMDRGRIFADGATREVLANGQLLEEHGLEVPFSLRE